MALVSVIVPIYQSENFLRRCVDSILSQTMRDIELILVNDGSVDESGVICDEYANDDTRVRVFHKSHSGVSETRQLGIENATGEYVIHCDSDDWMEPDMLQLLYQKAQETSADMVVCDYWEEYIKRKIHKEFSPYFDPSIDISEQMKGFSYCVWNKLIRKSCITINNLHFPPSICYAEDVYYTLRLLNTSPKISYVSLPLYHYNRQNKESLNQNVSLECLESHKKVLIKLSGCLNESLNKKLNSNKCRFLYEAFKSKYYSIKDLRKMFPEVHMLILPLAFVHYRRKISQMLFDLYRSISLKFKD